MEKLYKEDLVELINDIQHPIWIYDIENYQFLTVNRSAVTLLGYSYEEFMNMTILDIRSPEEQIYFLDNKSWKTYSYGVNSYYKIMKKNGEEVFTEIKSKEIIYRKRPARITTVYDLTERVFYEKQLREAEERFRISQELSLDGFTILKPIRNENNIIIDFEWEYVNAAASRILKFSAEELVGTRLLQKLPGNREILFPLFIKVMETGEPHDIEIQYEFDNIKGWFRNMAVKIAEGIAISFQDITQRKLQQQEIEIKNEELNNLIERISDTFIALDKNWNLTYANRSALRILNTDRSIIGKNFWSAFPGYKELLYPKFLQCFINQEPMSFEFEGQATPRWYKITVHPSPEGLSIYGVDITLSRAYEEQLMNSLKQKETLLKEVHHRIKNNLQVIISILNLQSYYIKDPAALEIFRQSQNRIRSMALIHEKLYKTENLSSINLENYISDIVKYLFSTYSSKDDQIKVEFLMEQIELDSNNAISVGLIVNELVSNCLKYAFPGKTKGTITISASINGELLFFEVSDNGIGFPDNVNYKDTNSLGLQLVNTLVDQLYGNIKMINSSGTSFRISFPYKK
jgi:PAS domain S-box-containing protein